MHQEKIKQRAESVGINGSVETPEPAQPPTALGIINDTVGYIPASPHNPEIYYTPGGEEVAAATLLSLRLMPATIIRQLLLGSARIICAHTYGEESEQIYFNLDNNEPIGKIQPDVIRISQVDKKEYEETLGLAGVKSGIIQIFATAPKQARKINMGAFLSLFQSLEGQDVEARTATELEIESPFLPDYDEIYIRLSQLQTKRGLSLSGVLSEWDSLEGCRELLDNLPDHLAHVPMTVAHEISHLAGVQNEALQRGAKKALPSLQPDCEQKFNEAAAAMNLPSAFMAFPPFRENQFSKYASQIFREEVLIPECLAAMCDARSLKKYEYFLSDHEEAGAELAACAIIGDINKCHGTAIPQSGLQTILPDSFRYVAQWIKEMPEVGQEQLDEAQSDFLSPDQQLLPRHQWLELCEKNLELD